MQRFRAFPMKPKRGRVLRGRQRGGQGAGEAGPGRILCGSASGRLIHRKENISSDMREKFYRFMQGRHGQDEFSRFLLGAVLVCIVLGIFVRSRTLGVVTWLLLFYAYFRIFSRNHAARYGENQRYLNATARFRYWLDQQKKLAGERRLHHIYTCPGCRQKIRIPKGKGKIMVRCPRCGREFQKRS